MTQKHCKRDRRIELTSPSRIKRLSQVLRDYGFPRVECGESKADDVLLQRRSASVTGSMLLREHEEALEIVDWRAQRDLFTRSDGANQIASTDDPG